MPSSHYAWALLGLTVVVLGAATPASEVARCPPPGQDGQAVRSCSVCPLAPRFRGSVEHPPHNESRTQARFHNEASTPVSLVWVHPDGGELPVAVVPVGVTHERWTFEGHVFRAYSAGADVVPTLLFEHVVGPYPITNMLEADLDDLPALPRKPVQRTGSGAPEANNIPQGFVNRAGVPVDLIFVHQLTGFTEELMVQLRPNQAAYEFVYNNHMFRARTADESLVMEHTISPMRLRDCPDPSAAAAAAEASGKVSVPAGEKEEEKEEAADAPTAARNAALRASRSNPGPLQRGALTERNTTVLDLGGIFAPLDALRIAVGVTVGTKW